MFDKDTSQLSSGYTNRNNSGTSYLRSTLRARVYSGDEALEEKLLYCQIYWKYYNNNHWAKNNDRLLSFNYVRAVIDKVNNFMIGKEGFEINIKDVYGDTVDEEVEKRYEGLINYNWTKNSKKVFMQNLLQMGAVCGDAYIFLYPNETEGYIEYKLLDTRNIIPLFKNGDYSDIIGYKSVKLLGTNEKNYIQKVTEYSKGMVRTYNVKETGQDAQKYAVEEKENDYDFIPIVHIQNVPMSDSYGGKSDMADVVKINKIFNEMAEDIKTIIDYYAQPTTVITGGTVGQLKRGVNQIWSGLPADANVQNLGLGEDLSASTNFLKLLKDAIHDLTGVPEEVLSKVQHISNTSAAALQMLYQPIIQAADKKSVTYGEGLQELHRMTCVMYAMNLNDHPLFTKLPEEAKDASKARKYFVRYITEVVWKYNLPNDRLSMLNEASIELDNKLGSRREIMERLGKRNIPKLEEEIKKDTEEIIRVEKEISKNKEKENGNEGGGNTPE